MIQITNPPASSLIALSPIALTGTSVDVTGLPAGIREINVAIVNFQKTVSDNLSVLRIGDSTGISSTSYTSLSTYLGAFVGGEDNTTGFIVADTGSSISFTGIARLINIGSNQWVLAGQGFIEGNSYSYMFNGRKVLSGELDRLRLTTLSGTDTFTAGFLQISYAR